MEDIHEKTFYRYMSEGEAEAVRRTGFLRGGAPGEVFFTEDLYERADEAKSKLPLKIRPQARMRFRIIGGIDLIREGSDVQPQFGEPGGGTEYLTLQRVEVEVIEVDNLV